MKQNDLRSKKSAHVKYPITYGDINWKHSEEVKKTISWTEGWCFGGWGLKGRTDTGGSGQPFGKEGIKRIRPHLLGGDWQHLASLSHTRVRSYCGHSHTSRSHRGSSLIWDQTPPPDAPPHSRAATFLFAILSESDGDIRQEDPRLRTESISDAGWAHIDPRAHTQPRLRNCLVYQIYYQCGQLFFLAKPSGWAFNTLQPQSQGSNCSLPSSVCVIQVPWPPQNMAESWKTQLQWEKWSSKTPWGVARPTDLRAGRGDALGPVSPTRGPCRSRARWVCLLYILLFKQPERKKTFKK